MAQVIDAFGKEIDRSRPASSSTSGNLTDRGYPSSTDPNPVSYKPSGSNSTNKNSGGGYSGGGYSGGGTRKKISSRKKSKKHKTNPGKIAVMANDMYGKLKDAEDKVTALFETIKASATTNNNSSFWGGTKARTWYSEAVRNCANGHYRNAKLANVYVQLCDRAIKIQRKDNPKSSTIETLTSKKNAYKNLANECESNYNKVLNWAKQ